MLDTSTNLHGKRYIRMRFVFLQVRQTRLRFKIIHDIRRFNIIHDIRVIFLQSEQLSRFNSFRVLHTVILHVTWMTDTVYIMFLIIILIRDYKTVSCRLLQHTHFQFLLYT